MFVRPHRATVNAYRKAQKKQKAYRIKTNAIIKKVVKDKNVLQTLYTYSEEDCLQKAGQINHLMVELQDAEKAIKKLKTQRRNLKKKIMQVEHEHIKIKKIYSWIDKFAMSGLVLTTTILTAVVMIPT